MVSSPTQPIRANPLIKLFRQQFKLTLNAVIVFCVLILAFLLTMCIHVHFDQAKVVQLLRNELFLLLPALLVVLNIAMSFRQWRYWQRIESLRVAVAAGNLSLPTVEQSDANATAFPLPYKMTLSYSMGSIWRFTGIFLIFFIIYIGFVAWMINATLLVDLLSERPPVIIVVAAAIICVLFVLLGFSLREQRRTIEVSQSGITMYGTGESGYVPWQEARLFAVYRSFNARDDQYSLTYELSSATDIVRWTVVARHPALGLLRMTPDIPLREYQQQTQALNALVVARTGLPLCDLRKEPA